MNAIVRVMVVATDADRGRELVATLEFASHEVGLIPEATTACDALRQQPPDLVVADLAGLPLSDQADIQRAAREAGVGLLAVAPGPPSPAEGGIDPDDWLAWERLGPELNARVAGLLRRHDREARLADPRFLALVVHDLRTPLNVFTLTIRALGQSVKAPTPDFEEDLSFLLENVRQIERMLAQLGDYSRMIEARGRSAAVEFQTRRFLTDFLEEKQSRRTPEFKGVRLEMTPETPEVVELDPAQARVALHHALANAATSTPDAAIRLRSGGSAGHWLLDVIVDQSPPPTVGSTPLQSRSFERLVGSNAERRGFDLALAARVTESFGGTARLEVEPGVRSTIRLAWPVRPDPTP